MNNKSRHGSSSNKEDSFAYAESDDSSNFREKLFESFSAYLRQPRGDGGDTRRGEIDGINFTMKDVQGIERAVANSEKIKEKEAELERRKANVRAIQAAGETFKKEQAAEREALKAKGAKLEKQYDKLKVKIDEKTEDCRVIREALEDSHADYIFFEPLLQKLGVNMEKMACSEGKPVHASGVGGTCSIWGCPRLDKENQEIPDNNSSK